MDERRFHDWLARSSRPGDAGILPLGDDVAALRSGPGLLLLTTDAFSVTAMSPATRTRESTSTTR